MTTFAVTGASGQLGHLVVEELLDREVAAADVVAIVRKSRNAVDLAELGVDVREADYASPSALDRALDGVERLLLVSSSAQGQRALHHANVIGAARIAGVSRVVYTSMLNVEDSTNSLVEEHRDSERTLMESGIQYVLLRNGWYAENYLGYMDQYIASGEIVAAAGTGRISAAARTDLATAAAVALLDEHEGNRTYELGGESFDLHELAALIATTVKKPVTYRELSPEDYIARLRSSGLDEPTATLIADLDASVAAGDLETRREDLAQLLNRPPTPLAQLVAAAATDGPV